MSDVFTLVNPRKKLSPFIRPKSSFNVVIGFRAAIEECMEDLKEANRKIHNRDQ